MPFRFRLLPLLLPLLSVLLCVASASDAAIRQSKGTFDDRFRQLDEVWPTPTRTRTAAGAPGQDYWQQQVDYRIDVSLDEDARRVTGSEVVTYRNNSPDTLRYLWLQLEQNLFRTDSVDHRTRTMAEPERITFDEMHRLQFLAEHDGGHRLTRVETAQGEPLDHVINGTQMRIDLPSPLAPGQSFRFRIDWNYDLVEEDAVNARAGYEHFPEDGNDIFLLAQWYPRLQAYSDYEAWHNREFIGDGEFTLEFGNYQVAITVPADHVVSATGTLQNPDAVLTAAQRARLEQARSADRPVYVITPEEAAQNESARAEGERTWRFQAGNVRDFAWASSRKFIWDAQGHAQPGAEHPLVMAMSFFPKEGDPLWSRFSTQAVIHTMEVYSRFSFDYPYPVAQSVNGPVGGMEYPMITFNGPRTDPQEDGTRTYTRGEKEFLIGVVIHEIGHIYFPMTVNSDERQWTWMDEGINTFLQFIAEQEWDPEFDSRGEPRDIAEYMLSENQVPIMTNSESLLQFGNNAYAKPATALVILRETILGRELFDFAFREYARRWKFKRPTPYDLFRTLEEASGVDLDWFWRGWFYSTDHVDIALDRVLRLKVDSQDPDVEYPKLRQEYQAEPPSRTDARNAESGPPPRIERLPWLTDFYNDNDPYTVSNKDRNDYQEYLEDLRDTTRTDPDWKRKVLERAVADDLNYYVLEFSNLGGLVMPIILELSYRDDSKEMLTLPAEIWRRDSNFVRYLLPREGELVSVVVDPYWETADSNVENNHYPRRIVPSRLELFEEEEDEGPIPSRDLMQDVKAQLAPAARKLDTPDAKPPRRARDDDRVPMKQMPEPAP